MAMNPLKFPGRNVSFCVAAGILYWLMTWTFANLSVDFWLNIPQGGNITRSLTQSPEQLRKCLEPEKHQGRQGRSTVLVGDAKSCLLDLGENQRDGSQLFVGRGTVEQWTLQLMDLHSGNYGILVLKGLHLLFLGIVNSVFGALFLFGVLLTFFVIAQSNCRGALGIASRSAQALMHHTTHLFAMWTLYCMLVAFNYNRVKGGVEFVAEKIGDSAAFGIDIVPLATPPNRVLTLLWAPVDFWVRAVYPIEMIVLGGLVGGLIFALYLSLAYGIGKVNADWVFSSQRIADYKCFLRMRFDPDKLTIYPICLDSVPDRGGWRWRKKPQPGQARVEPKSPLRPRLIEGPIAIRPDDIPRPGEQLRPKQAQA